MGRRVKDYSLDSRDARRRLKARSKPYFSSIGRGLHLGYRKGKNPAGRWVMRCYSGDGDYEVKTIATADDVDDANGVDVLDYWQAQDEAREQDRQRKRVARGEAPDRKGPYTVAHAIEDYLVEYDRRGGRSRQITEKVIDTHIRPPFSDKAINDLSRAQIRKWHSKLAQTPARLRTANGQDQAYREPSDDPETLRKRKSTANRILTVLKAILNHAYAEGLIASNDAWSAVKPFKGTEAAKVRYLSDPEVRHLINACSGDLRNIVTAALLTGARYSELANLRVKDFDAKARVLHVSMSKSGKPRHIALTDEGVRFFKRVAAGKTGAITILTRDNGSKWGHAQQSRPIREACVRAKIEPAIGFHILRHTYASRLAMKGVPMAVIAQQLGHADTRITEKHYAHLSPDYVSTTVREAFGDLGIVEQDNVTPISAGVK